MVLTRRAAVLGGGLLAVLVLHAVIATVATFALAVLLAGAAGYALRHGGWRLRPMRDLPAEAALAAPAVPEFAAAVDELRKLARRSDGEAREPLLRIARHLSALSRAGLPEEETRQERQLAQALQDSAASLRIRGGAVTPAAVAPLIGLAEALEQASDRARLAKERDFADTARSLGHRLRGRA
ncbi:hypothetical protein [Mangrovicoccus sp. HB161399]|uniref:hypothetical protein n=1 Tax=Mangrovicoccus sp. HB161399 TaxID=2720392 RepID=UPI00155325AA|nr:hypothetical protein [Mangrovicoccus sp. HB161399]